MSSKRQSSQQSQNSSFLPTRSLVASKVSCDLDEAKLLQDLGHNYIGVEKVFRRYDKDGKPMGFIRIDFKAENVAMKIIDSGYILIDGKQCPVQSYSPLICHRCQNEGHYASNCPQKPLTEQRAMEILKQQKKQFETMINEFERKWNARLSESTTSSNHAHVNQLSPIFRDLKTVCEQFNQQNVQMQRALHSIVNRGHDIQTKLNNEQAQPT
ncbi:unnamed protein product [Rotaria sordida]|uniref:CCHC-type domain-containing protein n=1 Tax=Rotaria sordida TaxID=392033 RepID=A0A814ITC1_9BILA|nr:unnamed protein product [Rotaria sordida]